MADTTARAELKGFADAGRVSSWAEEAMQWAVAEGLMTGIANGDSLNLAPQKVATRAELAAFLMRVPGAVAPWLPPGKPGGHCPEHSKAVRLELYAYAPGGSAGPAPGIGQIFSRNGGGLTRPASPSTSSGGGKQTMHIRQTLIRALALALTRCWSWQRKSCPGCTGKQA